MSASDSFGQPFLIVNGKDAIAFKGLTSKSLRAKLDNIAQRITCKNHETLPAYVAWGVRSHEGQGEPVALLLACVQDACDGESISLQIDSLAVRKAWQGNGIASNLVETASRWARKYKINEVTLVMPLGQLSTTALDRMTQKEAGWNDDPGKTLVTLSDPMKVGPLLFRLDRMAKRQKRLWGWKIRPYPEGINAELKERIDAVENNDIQKPYNPMHPFEFGIHSRKYSRILIAEGKIIGWLVANQVSTNLIRYAGVWVDPGWEKSGGLLAMVADVMHSAHFAGIDLQNINQNVAQPIAKGCFAFHPDYINMSRMSERHFRPVSDQWVETRIRSCQLSNTK